MKLTTAQRAKLMSVRKSENWSRSNRDLDIAIAEIKSENPGAFLTEDTLILRRFYDQPLWPIPYRDYVRGAK